VTFQGSRQGQKCYYRGNVIFEKDWAPVRQERRRDRHKVASKREHPELGQLLAKQERGNRECHDVVTFQKPWQPFRSL